MRTAILTALLLGFAAVLPARAGEGDAKPEVQKASDEEAKHELMMFERDFDTVDIDFKLNALKRLGKCVHKDVTDTLLKVLFRDPDAHVRAAAAKGLANQAPFAEQIGRKATRLLEDDKLDPKLLAEVVRALGKLGYTRAWEQIADLISHDEDVVVIACFDVFGAWKDLRARREMLIFWEMYPEEGKWSTGSVTVDTGAAGNADANAAKAKWKAKYGNAAKLRPRPDCVKALKAAVKEITGEEIAKGEDFRKWCDEHKREVQAADRNKN